MQFAQLHLIVALSVIIHIGVTLIFSVDDNILNYLEPLHKIAEFFSNPIDILLDASNHFQVT